MAEPKLRTVNSVRKVRPGLFDVYEHHREGGETIVRFGTSIEAKTDKEGFVVGRVLKIDGRNADLPGRLRRNGTSQIEY